MGVTLTIADAKEIRDNLCNLAKLLWQWEKNARKEKEQEEQCLMNAKGNCKN